MRRLLLACSLVLALSGCVPFLPLPLPIALGSAGLNGLALLTKGKTSTDVLLSAAQDRNCALYRVVNGETICRDYEPGEQRLAVQHVSPRSPAGDWQQSDRVREWLDTREGRRALAQLPRFWPARAKDSPDDPDPARSGAEPWPPRAEPVDWHPDTAPEPADANTGPDDWQQGVQTALWLNSSEGRRTLAQLPRFWPARAGDSPGDTDPTQPPIGETPAALPRQ